MPRAPPEAAAGLVPKHPTLRSLAAAASACRACPRWERATQTVFGEGLATARLVLVGEVPGDIEDRSGRPFVGRAGRLLDRALAEAGIDRRDTYVTNAVKHFKWAASGKKRLHQKPNAREQAACRPWLEAELEVVRPVVLLALGSTAAQLLFGRSFRVTQGRGQLVPSELAPYALATIHPSAILRAPTDAARHEAYAGFLRDLRIVRAVLDRPPRDREQGPRPEG